MTEKPEKSPYGQAEELPEVEDQIPQPQGDDLDLTREEEEILKQKLEELRKRDPFVYR
jgi:hypothetical protein